MPGAIDAAVNTARTKSLRLLAENLNTRLQSVVGGSMTPDEIKRMSQQLVEAIGRVTGTWQSPTCTTYAIAEIKLSDFRYVVEGPSSSAEIRATLLQNTDKIIGRP
jgi:hypothetical protein